MDTTKEMTGVVGAPLDPLEITGLTDDSGEPLMNVPVEYHLEKGAGEFAYKDDHTDTQGGCIAEFIPSEPGRVRIECRIGPYGEQKLFVFRALIEGRREEDPKVTKRRRRKAKPKAKETVEATPPPEPTPPAQPIEEPTPAPPPAEQAPQEPSPAPVSSPQPPAPAPVPAPRPPAPAPQQRPAPQPPRRQPANRPRRRTPVVPFSARSALPVLLLFAALLALVLLATALARPSSAPAGGTTTQTPVNAVDCTNATKVRYLENHRMVIEGCSPHGR